MDGHGCFFTPDLEDVPSVLFSRGSGGMGTPLQPFNPLFPAPPPPLTTSGGSCSTSQFFRPQPEAGVMICTMTSFIFQFRINHFSSGSHKSLYIRFSFSSVLLIPVSHYHPLKAKIHIKKTLPQMLNAFCCRVCLRSPHGFFGQWNEKLQDYITT